MAAPALARFPAWLCALACWLLIMGAARAEVDIAGLQHHFGLAGQFQYTETDRRLTLEQARQLPASAWRSDPQGKSNFGASTRVLWLRFSVQGAARLPEPAYLRINYPPLDRIDLHVLQGRQHIAHIRTGDHLPFSARPLAHHAFVFPLEARYGDRFDIYLRIETESLRILPLDIVSRSQLERDDRQFLLMIGLYYGVVLIMLVYNTCLLVLLRQRHYLFYVLHVAAVGAHQFVILGLGYEYVWPGLPVLNHYALPLLIGLLPLTAIAFGVAFMNIFSIGSRAEKIWVRALLVASGLVMASAFLLPYMYAVKLGHITVVLAIPSAFYLGIKYWLKGVKSARIFALAWFSHLLFTAWYMADIVGLVPSSVWSQNAFMMGSALELALLSIAFADKTNEEKELRLQAQADLLATQRHMNEDLERRVHQRTEELEDANRKLQEISITDSLTGLRNRRYFDTAYTGEYQRALREREWLSVLMVDIDFFKRLNDNHGHQAGDLCLKTAGELIAGALRRPTDLAARYGGEEFVLVLPATDPAGALSVAQQIHERFAETVLSMGEASLRMTVSIGVASQIPTVNGGRDLLLKQADTHLYLAKARGRNRTVGQAGEDAAAEAMAV